MLQAICVKIGPQYKGQIHWNGVIETRCGKKRINVSLTDLPVISQREYLLELISDQQDVSGPGLSGGSIR